MKYFVFICLLILVSSCTGDLNVAYDWCYTLDYTDNQDGTSIGSGDWSFGLGMYPDEDGDLVFAYVHDRDVSWTQVIVNFELPISSVVPLSLQGGVFGSPLPYTSVTVNTTTQNLHTAYFYPSQALTSGRTITAIVHAPFLPESTFLQSIEIRGVGTNPFDTNECGEDATATPTATATPSGTSALVTFSDDDGSWQDWEWVDFGEGTPFIDDYDGGAVYGDVSRVNRFYTGSQYSISQWVRVNIPTSTVSRVQFEYAYFRTSDNANPAYYMRLYDSDDNQLAETGTNFTANGWRFTLADVDISNVSYVLFQVNRGSPGASSDARTYMDNLTIYFTPDPEPIATSPVTATPTNVMTRTPISIPATATITPTSTATTYISPTPTLTPSVSVTPSPTFTPSNTPEYIIVTDGTDGTITPSTYDPFDWLKDIFETISGVINGIFELIGKIWNILVLLIEIIFALIGLLLAWILEALGRLWALLLAFFNTPSIPIPGVPMCVTAPLDHQLCALYFIADWTLLASGTYGEYIVPLALAFMNTILIFRTVRYILALIRGGEDVTR